MEQLKDALKEFGWTSYQARCYIALVNYGDMKASQIASEAGINKSKIYQPLSELEEKSYVRIVDNNPKIYSAQNPQYVIEQEREKFRDTTQQVLGDLQEAWEIQNDLSDEDNAAWVTRGRQGKQSELSQLIDKAEKSIKGFDVRLVQLSRSLITDLENAAEQGLDISLISGSQAKDKLERLQRAGADVRELTDIKRSSFYIIDEETVLLCLSSDNSTVVLEDEDATRIIGNEFETVYQEASEVTNE